MSPGPASQSLEFRSTLAVIGEGFGPVQAGVVESQRAVFTPPRRQLVLILVPELLEIGVTGPDPVDLRGLDTRRPLDPALVTVGFDQPEQRAGD